MLWLPLIWLALFAILTGWGMLLVWTLRRLGGAGFRGVFGVFQTLWLGYAGLLAFLQLCSFALPMAGLVLAMSLPPAAAGWWLQRASVARWYRALWLRPRITAVCAGVLVLTWLVVAWTASNAIHLYDTGLYHYQAIKWFTSYPVVPGLANLHLRFGYNNSVHVFGGYVDAFWEGVAVHAMNGFLVAALLGQWFVEIFAARTPRGRLRQVFCLLTLPFLIAKLWSMEMASLSSDLALAVFCLVLVLEMLSLQTHSRQRLLPLALIVALGAVAVSTKLGGLALFGVASLLALFLVRRDVTWRARVLIFALPALIVLGWMIRGVILSGWLVFPVFGRIGFEWAVQPKVAKAHMLEIQSWGRVFGKAPEEVFGRGFMNWFVPWFLSFKTTRELPLFIVALATFTWRLVSGPTRYARICAEWAAIAACILGLVQWFTGAPDVRYGGFLFWLLVAVLLAPMLARAMRDATMRVLVLLACLGAMHWSGAMTVELGHPPTAWGRLPDPRVPPTSANPAGPNTTIYVPTDSPQCWDAPLPCAVHSAKVTLRNPGSLGDGFLAGPRKPK